MGRCASVLLLMVTLCGGAEVSELLEKLQVRARSARSLLASVCVCP